MWSPAFSVADAVAAFLERQGVAVVFGVLSMHNMGLVLAIARKGIRFVPARSEAGAGHMADAHARVTGELGVFVTSTGPGAAIATPALLEAWSAGSPVLHLTGQVAQRHLDRRDGANHELPRQREMLAAVGKGARLVRRREEVWPALVSSIELALTPPRGPVSLALPWDLAAEPHPALVEGSPACGQAAPAPAAEDVAAVASELAEARRPLLWVGGGARGGEASIARLADAGVGVFTSRQGRGLLPDHHPMALGVLASCEELVPLRGASDLVVVAGSRLRAQDTRDHRVELPRALIRVDLEPEEPRAYPPSRVVVADAPAFLAAVAARLPVALGVAPTWRAEIAAARDAARAGIRRRVGHHARIADAIVRVWPRDTTWVRDVSLGGSAWGHTLVPVAAVAANVYPVSSAVGPGAALGIGAALAAPHRRTLVLCGDAGFVAGAAELSTAVQERVPLTVLVLDDRGYETLRRLQREHFGSAHVATELHTPDLGLLARAIGVEHWRVEDLDVLEPALAAAAAHEGPSVVEVDLVAVGPMPFALDS